MMRITSISVCMMLMLAPFDSRSSAQVKTGVEHDEILDRRVPGGAFQYPATTASAFTRVLKATGVPGGVVRILACEAEPETQTSIPSGESLEEVLNHITTADLEYRWEYDKGTIDLIPATGEPLLLQVRINRYSAKFMKGDKQLQEILSLPEIQEAKVRLGLTDGLQIGVNEMRTTPSTSRFDGLTLREALNLLAGGNGRLIWEYRERHCNGKNEVWIDFVSQKSGN